MFYVQRLNLNDFAEFNILDGHIVKYRWNSHEHLFKIRIIRFHQLKTPNVIHVFFEMSSAISFFDQILH